MTPRFDEKQCSVRLNEDYISKLNRLAELGAMNRHHLMLCLINVWLSVLNKKGVMPHVFNAAVVLRELQGALDGIPKPDYSVYIVPEKPLPMKFTEGDIFDLERFASFSHISRHQLMKDMLMVGIEELGEITNYGEYQYGEVEPKLFKSLELIMKKGEKAFNAFKAGGK